MDAYIAKIAHYLDFQFGLDQLLHDIHPSLTSDGMVRAGLLLAIFAAWGIMDGLIERERRH